MKIISKDSGVRSSYLMDGQLGMKPWIGRNVAIADSIFDELFYANKAGQAS